MIVWLQFIACTAIIVFAGAKLSKYGDIIADLTGMGRMWIGVVLLASVTSLPELITGVSSVTLYDLPNIAVGDVLGSCMFNLLIIACRLKKSQNLGDHSC
jgi:cation:H+ antiporter